MPLQLKLTLNEDILSLETNSRDLQEWILQEYGGKLFEKDIEVKNLTSEKRYLFNNLDYDKLVSSLEKYQNNRNYTK